MTSCVTTPLRHRYNTVTLQVEELLDFLRASAPTKSSGEMASLGFGANQSSLAEELLLWVSARQDISTLKTCIAIHKQRAALREVGLRYMAATLRLFSYSDANVSHALRLLKQARPCNRHVTAM